MEKQERLEEIMSNRVVQVKNLETWFGIDIRNPSFIINDGTSASVYFEVVAVNESKIVFPFNIFAVFYDNRNKIISKRVERIEELSLGVFDVREFRLETISYDFILELEDNGQYLRDLDEDTKMKILSREYDKYINKILLYPSRRQVRRYFDSNEKEYITKKDIQIERACIDKIICDKEKEKEYGIDIKNIMISSNRVSLEMLTLSGNPLESPFFLRVDVYDKSGTIVVRKRQRFTEFDLINQEIVIIDSLGELEKASKITIYPSTK